MKIPAEANSAVWLFNNSRLKDTPNYCRFDQQFKAKTVLTFFREGASIIPLDKVDQLECRAAMPKYWKGDQLVVNWRYQNPWRIDVLGANLVKLDLKEIFQ
jgi:hypothetical protein